MTLHRIYFDTNEQVGDDCYDLGIPGSRADIEPIADQLRDGMRVVIYMGNELELEAILRFDSEHNHWTATGIRGTLKYLDEL